MTRHRLTFALFVALSASSTAAKADQARSCIAVADEGQTFRDDGHLVAARGDFESCALAACPAPVRKQCVFWSAEVEARIPTVVLHPTKDGSEAAGAQVLVDGKVVERSAPGQGLPLDPGKHAFRFELAGSPPVEEEVVLREGEKLRAISASFASAAPPPALGAGASVRSEPAPQASPESTAPPAGAVELSAFVGGGVPLDILEKGTVGPLLFAASIEADWRPVPALEAGLAVGVAGTGLELDDAPASLKSSGGYRRIEVAVRGRWHFVRASSADVWAGPELDVFGDSIQLTGATSVSDSFNHDTLLLGGGLIAGVDFPVSKAFSLGVMARGFGGFGVADWPASCSAACNTPVPGGTHDFHASVDFGIRVQWSLPYGKRP